MKRLFFILCALCSIAVHGQEMVDLSGLWECSVGDSLNYKDYVELPGLHQAQGAVWYKKSVYVPQSWKDERVTIFLERPYHETTVFVNGEKILRQMSLSTPHQCDVTRWLKPGQRNTIIICVDNGMERWNGIAGCMELRAQPKELYIEKVRVRPDLDYGCVHLSLDAGGPHSDTYQLYNNHYTIAVMKDGDDPSKAIIHQRYLTEPHIEYDFDFIDSVYLWHELHPQLYRIGISLGDDYYETTFGMCNITAKDRQLYINGHPICLRGTVESTPFMETGNPPMTVEEWKNIFTKYKEYGLNSVCFRSYCPPEAAFMAADKLGLYLQVEIPSGSIEESKRIVDTFGHHPSLMILTVNNESAARGWEETMKKYDNTKIYNLKIPSIALGDSANYKQEIERNLGTKDCVGFMLSSFDDVRERVSVGDWIEYCSPIVALANFPKTDYTDKDTLVVSVEVNNAMYGVLQNIRSSYYLTDTDQHVLYGGTLSVGDIPVGKNINIGTVSYPLDIITKPTKLTLTVIVAGQVKNHWDFWVHPVSS